MLGERTYEKLIELLLKTIEEKDNEICQKTDIAVSKGRQITCLTIDLKSMHDSWLNTSQELAELKKNVGKVQSKAGKATPVKCKKGK